MWKCSKKINYAANNNQNTVCHKNKRPLARGAVLRKICSFSERCRKIDIAIFIIAQGPFHHSRWNMKFACKCIVVEGRFPLYEGPHCTWIEETFFSRKHTSRGMHLDDELREHQCLTKEQWGLVALPQPNAVPRAWSTTGKLVKEVKGKQYRNNWSLFTLEKKTCQSHCTSNNFDSCIPGMETAYHSVVPVNRYCRSLR